MVSRKTAWIVGLTGVTVTAVLCGCIIRNEWKEVQMLKKPETTVSQPKTPQPLPEEYEGEKIIVNSGSSETFADSILEDGKVKKEGQKLIIDDNPVMYTYDNMEADIQMLLAGYPRWLTCEEIAKTVDRRSVYCLIIGNPQAGQSILMGGGIHGREYMTSQLVMKQTVAFLRHLEAGDSYHNVSYEKLLENTAIYSIPMINPDGVSISQKGMDGILTESVKEQIRNIAQLDGQQPEGSYLERWKANAAGVDLNRNFDAQWQEYQDPVGHPSSDHYKGTSPGSEPESAALIGLTEEKRFLRTVSYHTQGSVIYWYFGQEGQIYQDTFEFGQRIAGLTGYDMDADISSLDPAGYKDWAISVLGIPSLTIEIGRDSSPVPPKQFEEIWKRNEYVWEETLLGVLE